MRNNIISPVWEDGDLLLRMLNAADGSEMASIFRVDIGLVSVVNRWGISVEAGEDVENTFHRAVAQARGKEFSYKDVVRDRRGAKILAESFVAQRHVWRHQ